MSCFESNLAEGGSETRFGGMLGSLLPLFYITVEKKKGKKKTNTRRIR